MSKQLAYLLTAVDDRICRSVAYQFCDRPRRYRLWLFPSPIRLSHIRLLESTQMINTSQFNMSPCKQARQDIHVARIGLTSVATSSESDDVGACPFESLTAPYVLHKLDNVIPCTSAEALG